MEQSEAILIKKNSWSDASIIATWLTCEYGKISTLARAARSAKSPLAGRLDLFYRAEIAFTTSRRTSLHTLSEIRLVEAFDASLVSCTNVFLCGYFAEIADLATEPGHPAPEMYDLLSRAVRHLRIQPATLKALTHFEKELCHVFGAQNAHPLSSIETYCGRIPASRAMVMRLLLGS